MLKCSKNNSDIFLSCVLTLSQMFPTMFEPKEICNWGFDRLLLKISGKTPGVCTSERGRKLANLTGRDTNETYLTWPGGCLTAKITTNKLKIIPRYFTTSSKYDFIFIVSIERPPVAKNYFTNTWDVLFVGLLTHFQKTWMDDGSQSRTDLINFWL